MATIKINRLTSIEASAQDTLLEAMEKAGLEPEYHCRDGHCGACRCTLSEGQVESVGFAMAYTNPGEVLACISKAKGDIVLDNVRYQHKKVPA
ncbi:2Fe-2S iron-sulfur cluster-binding protein [Vibrio agarivorans]|uniref:2Fe-2S iron-sulfur cluster-binding protein n=1 Tax=Vibrio agarivorans TaxID=153622 RepID=UPI0025B4BE0C|nr:2Fe-2S iron-sulfur cluster-binding protein [Vibrio agarivorans]MDN3663224.1 2Fe-2S iron-sulfur cluster-binding protein [Vibrio agarivorans]